MKVAFWFVGANTPACTCSLIFSPTNTAKLYFWEFQHSINAALFGALYQGRAATVALDLPRAVGHFLVPILVSTGAPISLTTLLLLESSLGLGRVAPAIGL